MTIDAAVVIKNLGVPSDQCNQASAIWTMPGRSTALKKNARHCGCALRNACMMDPNRPLTKIRNKASADIAKMAARQPPCINMAQNTSDLRKALHRAVFQLKPVTRKWNGSSQILAITLSTVSTRTYGRLLLAAGFSYQPTRLFRPLGK